MVRLRGYITAREANETYHEIEEAYKAAATLEDLEMAKEEYCIAMESLAVCDEIQKEKYGFSYQESLEDLFEERKHNLISFPQLERF